jgi:hypothetical protein
MSAAPTRTIVCERKGADAVANPERRSVEERLIGQAQGLIPDGYEASFARGLTPPQPTIAWRRYNRNTICPR